MRATVGAVLVLVFVPALLAAFAVFGPFVTDATLVFGGMSYDVGQGPLLGTGTIDPNMGFTAYALGLRAAREVLSGALPLWNHYEGLGAPLLGEMQSAALFPPTLLLLLPHGQMIEQAFLQAVAGLGTFLFLRRFGLGVAAALAGGLLFELNGVFAWLRNAIFNPVAFLPWLFYVVESLFVAAAGAAAAGRRMRERVPMVALGAVAAALAVYAGFPEIVYLYSLLVLLWAAGRAVALPWRRALAFAGDLAGVGVLALMISAPVLLAFGGFIGQAELGGHQADRFADATLPPPAMLMYLLPYVFGPIFALAHPILNPIWGGIGGYVGIMPLLLGLGGLITGWRRPMLWVLGLWILLAVGATQNAPLLKALFVHVPLVKITAYCRYLNASWSFAAIVLSAAFIDRIPVMPRSLRLRVGTRSVLLTLVVLAGAVIAARPLLSYITRAHMGRTDAALSFAVAGLLLALAAGAFCLRTSSLARTAIILFASVEALAAFLVPFASFPRRASLDQALISFLQQNIGMQRVAAASGAGIAPNFASTFEIPYLNWDDLPVPRRTIDFIHKRIDASADPILFRPNAIWRGLADERVRRADLIAHLPEYAAAGVRYLLAEPNFFAVAAYDLKDMAAQPTILHPAQTLRYTIGAGFGMATLKALVLRVATFKGRADGQLRARICQADRCAEGVAGLKGAVDNSGLLIRLSQSMTLTADTPYELTLNTIDGHEDVAVWSLPLANATASPDEPVPEMAFVSAQAPAPVLQTPTTAVFELASPRPYVQAEGCRVEAGSFDTITADCERASRLVRLEVMMEGWQARVNGVAAPVVPVEETFQAVDLPAGRSTVAFRYAPRGVRESAWLAAATLLGLLAACVGVRVLR